MVSQKYGIQMETLLKKPIYENGVIISKTSWDENGIKIIAVQ